MKKLIFKLSMFFSLAILMVGLFCSIVKADYNPNFLISDPVFTQTGSMSQSDIQSFLSSLNSGLTNYKDTESCYSSSDPHYSLYTQYYACGQYVSASKIIFDAAQVYGISPRVILATLQKEQSLVTDPNPQSSQLNCAMGYSSCGGIVGFFYQVDYGAWDLSFLYHRAAGDNNYWDTSLSYPCRAAISGFYSAGLFPGGTVTFADSGGTPETITIVSASTAALYCYTPYVGPYNVTGYSGSYNFVVSFDQWWGSTIDDCIILPLVPPGQQSSHNTLPGNYAANGQTDVSVYDPAKNCWHVRGYGDVGFGQAGDIPVPGNYSGYGMTEVAVYRPSNGTWHIRGGGDFSFGQPGDIPVPADYTGSGVTNIAVYRPSNGTWHISGVGDFQFGQPGDIPVPGAYSGNGMANIAVYRPSDGTWHIRGVGDFQFGQPGDIPVPGYYGFNGNVDGLAVYRPSNGGWYIRGIGDFAYGASQDVPVPGYYGFNGNSVEGLAVYDPDNGAWHIRGVGDYPYGIFTDIPVNQPLNTYWLKQYGLISSY